MRTPETTLVARTLDPSDPHEVDAACRTVSRELAREYPLVLECHGASAVEEVALEAFDAFLRRSRNRALGPVEHPWAYLRRVVRSKYVNRVQDILAGAEHPTAEALDAALGGHDETRRIEDGLDARAVCDLLDALADTVIADTDPRYEAPRARAWREIRDISLAGRNLSAILIEDYAADPSDEPTWKRLRQARYQSHLRFRDALGEEAARWPDHVERAVLLAAVGHLAWCEKSPAIGSLR